MKLSFVSTLVLVLFAASSHATINVDINCDNELWFYADGVAFVNESSPGYNRYWQADHVQVPTNTKVYAIKCLNKGGIAGILSGFDDQSHTVTDSSWRCTNADPGGSGWMFDTYDDSAWSPAYNISSGNSASTTSWGKINGISDQAQWIWTTRWGGNGDATVYCRKHIQDLCSRDLEMWSNEGCIWDRADYCVPINTITKCGWGTRRHYYYCGPDDVRDCIYKCYKPCADEVLTECSPENTMGCNVVITTACSSKCGVGDVIIQWSCPEDSLFTCNEDSCCDRCTGGLGNQGAKVCNAENMALPMSDYAGLCPSHVFGPV